MGYTVFASIAVLFLCSYVSDAHRGHRFSLGDLLRKECAQASNHETTGTDACIQCFNESRVEGQNDEPENEEPENEERYGGHGGHDRPGPGLGFGRQNFDSTRLGDCVKNYLGGDYTDCSSISSSEASRIESARILQCIFHRFGELVARQCASKATTDDLRDFYTCQRNVFREG